MKIEVLSVFPEVFGSYMSASIMGRAQAVGALEFKSYDLRDWTYDVHRSVDDAPFGGGQGMLMKCGPLYEAITDIAGAESTRPYIVVTTPSAPRFDQAAAERLASYERLFIVCGRYEGIDERVFDLADERLSIGDYVLTGGELAAMVIADAVVRLIPGVLGDENSALDESFSDGLLEYAQYTRPANYHGKQVPEVLLSGNHAQIDAWRRQSALERTARFRPDLLDAAELSSDERSWLAAYFEAGMHARQE